jgi:hypothetical protein
MSPRAQSLVETQGMDSALPVQVRIAPMPKSESSEKPPKAAATRRLRGLAFGKI